MPSTPFANRPANRSRTLHQVAIHASATIPQFSRGSLTNSRTTLVHLTTPPKPKPGPPRQPNHSPSLKSPQITVQTTPVQTPLRIPQPATYATTKNQKLPFLTNTPNTGTISTGFTVQNMAFAATWLASRLVSLSAAQDDIHHDAITFIPTFSTTPCDPPAQPYHPGFPPNLAQALSPQTKWNLFSRSAVPCTRPHMCPAHLM